MADSVNPIGYMSVTLPSRGYLYGGKIPGGQVEVRKLTVGEELIIHSTSGGVDLIARLVKACVRMPNAFDPLELLATDRLALLIAMRVATFGPKYNYSYRCQSCGSNQKAEANLGTDLQEKLATDTLKEPIPVHLKDAQTTIGLRFLRGKDEAQVAAVSKKIALQSNDAVDTSVLTRMALQIVAIAEKEVGKDPETGRDMLPLAEREAFVRGLSIPDAEDFRDAIDTVEPGVDLKLNPDCKACGSQNEIYLPFSADFFRPTRNRP
jgi:hypothetical protein